MFWYIVPTSWWLTGRHCLYCGQRCWCGIGCVSANVFVPQSAVWSQPGSDRDCRPRVTRLCCPHGTWGQLVSSSSACFTFLTQKHTLTHLFNGPLSGTTWVGRYQKSKTSLDFTEARDSEWQWHQLYHMQVCTSLQTDNHASSPPLSFLQAFLPPSQQCQSTEGSSWLARWY